MLNPDRAQLFAALGDPVRLAIIEDLMISDQSPNVLGERHELPSNLLAHHLDVLEAADLISRSVSSGDRRRRYVRLRHETLAQTQMAAQRPDRPVLFVCTHNSARSQLAAALWNEMVDSPALSAGTDPSPGVHPGAIAAAERAGLDLTGAKPRHLDSVDSERLLVITVCDQAHEQLGTSLPHWHWSTPDPVTAATPESFDDALLRLRRRINAVAAGADG